MKPSAMVAVVESLPAAMRNQVLQFTVFGQPQPKQRPRKGSFGFFTPKETAAYEELVKTICMASTIQFSVHAGVRWEPNDEYAVHVSAFMSDGRIRDLDNIVKSLLDGMQPFVVANDHKVKFISATQIHHDKQPRAEVLVRRMKNFTELRERSKRLLLSDSL